MRLCLFDEGRLGLVQGDEVLDVSGAMAALPPFRYPLPTADVLIANLADLRPRIAAAAIAAERRPLSSVRLSSPVMNPGKIVAAPFNYRDGRDLVEHAGRIHAAGLFLKATSSVIGAAQGITLACRDRTTDYEVELAVVIGRICRQVGRDDALSCVAGYTIGLDITLHGPQERSLRKSLDSYTVLGPALVTADELGDPGTLDLGLELNGQPRQRANTRDLVLDVPALIEYASSYYTLHPGDVLLTGSPSGVAALAPGDRIRAWIAGLGELDVAVR